VSRFQDRFPLPVRVVTVYVAVSLLWILFSDAALGALVSDPGTLQLVATLKGWAFVAITALLIYTLLEADRRRLASLDAQRASAETRTSRILETVPDAVLFFSEGASVTYANRAAQQFAAVLGAKLEGDVIHSRDWRFWDGLGRAVAAEDLPVSRMVREGKAVYGDVISFERVDGDRVWVSISVVPSDDDFGLGTGALVTLTDITERMRSSQRVERLNRLYSVLGEASRLLVAPDSKDMLGEVCRIVTGLGGFRMAWVGLVDEPSGLVRPVAEGGFVDGYLDGLVVSSRDVPEGRGPVGKAIRNSAPFIENDYARSADFAPWLERALSRGYRATAAFPLRLDGRPIGALTVYAGTTGLFGREEVALLERLADYVSFALDSERAASRRAESEARLEDRLAELTTRAGDLERAVEVLTAEVAERDGRIARLTLESGTKESGPKKA